jgi:hypothetical protein
VERLRVAPRLGFARHVEVRGLPSQVVVLEPGAEPGSYDLPIHVSAPQL